MTETDKLLKEFKEETDKLSLEEDISIETNQQQEAKQKLNKQFNKIDNSIKKKQQLLNLKEQLEEQSKSNPILQKYIDTLEKIQKIDDELTKSKTYLYEQMLNTKTKLLEGHNCKITLKEPYYKTNFDINSFIQDYGPNTKMYKKYVSKKLIKGNITLKNLI